MIFGGVEMIFYSEKVTSRNTISYYGIWNFKKKIDILKKKIKLFEIKKMKRLFKNRFLTFIYSIYFIKL